MAGKRRRALSGGVAEFTAAEAVGNMASRMMRKAIGGYCSGCAVVGNGIDRLAAESRGARAQSRDVFRMDAGQSRISVGEDGLLFCMGSGAMLTDNP